MKTLTNEEVETFAVQLNEMDHQSHMRVVLLSNRTMLSGLMGFILARFVHENDVGEAHKFVGEILRHFEGEPVVPPGSAQPLSHAGLVECRQCKREFFVAAHLNQLAGLQDALPSFNKKFRYCPFCGHDHGDLAALKIDDGYAIELGDIRKVKI